MKILDDIKTLSGKKEPAAPKNNSTKKTILIVEDEIPLATVLENRLKEEGFNTFVANNGEAGLDLAAEHVPDLILLDLLMPIMDGKIMLRKLREIPQCKTIPVIVLTNAGDIDNVRETQFFSDAVEFLIKSNVSLDEIVKKIKTNTLATRIS